jgi:4-hydroxy-2-oxoheptanedioate aldolase
MSLPDLKAMWREGRRCVNGWCSIPSTVTAEIAALQPFDTLTVDLQHGLVDYQAALTMLQAMSRHPGPKLARTRWNEPGLIMALLDAGFTGIICPMVNSAEDARRFVSACRYAPRGGRSFGPTRAALVYGAEYVGQADDRIATLAMIETREALAALDAILGVEELDAVYIGPSDLSLSLGHPPTLMPSEPEVLEAIETIRTKAQAAGKFAGIHCGDPAGVRARLEQGFDLATLSTDTRILSAALAERLDAARPEAVEGRKALY